MKFQQRRLRSSNHIGKKKIRSVWCTKFQVKKIYIYLKEETEICIK